MGILQKPVDKVTIGQTNAELLGTLISLATIEDHNTISAKSIATNKPRINYYIGNESSNIESSITIGAGFYQDAAKTKDILEELVHNVKGIKLVFSSENSTLDHSYTLAGNVNSPELTSALQVEMNKQLGIEATINPQSWAKRGSAGGYIEENLTHGGSWRL